MVEVWLIVNGFVVVTALAVTLASETHKPLEVEEVEDE